jgi:hypothetical protein
MLHSRNRQNMAHGNNVQALLTQQNFYKFKQDLNFDGKESFVKMAVSVL